LRRLEFHYTPRHASWLNIVEIEIGAIRRQCLDRRIDSRARLETEVRAWERRRTESGTRIRWMFSTDQARVKMAKSYPTPRSTSHNHCDGTLVPVARDRSRSTFLKETAFSTPRHHCSTISKATSLPSSRPTNGTRLISADT
jgi:hypothetical protein